MKKFKNGYYNTFFFSQLWSYWYYKDILVPQHYVGENFYNEQHYKYKYSWILGRWFKSVPIEKFDCTGKYSQ